MVHEARKRYGNYILTFLVMAVNVLLLGICFDFYYDLNDDTMMHDIMAGIYTGTPDGHNMQTLYPLGAVLAFCYRLCRQIPWYGLFLCLCQFGCFYLVGVRLCNLADNAFFLAGTQSGGKFSGWKKLLFLLTMSLYLWGVCLPHFINIQYTITCAMLSAGAIFLFLTSRERTGAGQFFVDNIPSILLVLVAYQLRSEMLLLTFPFIGLAGLYRMAEEEKVFAKETLCRYGAVLGTMLGGMLLCLVVDYAAYGSPAWKDFRDFFDDRTTVYDFYQELITEEAYGEALTELGVGLPQQILLRNYNFGLDDKIDGAFLGGLADYAVYTIGESKDWGDLLREQIGRYLYRIFRGGDGSYSLVVLWAYMTVLVVGFCMIRSSTPGNQKEQDQVLQGKTYGKVRRFAFLWQVVLLAAVRTAVWMFILMRGREPERITHSLYMVEFALLAAMCVRILKGQSGEGIVSVFSWQTAGNCVIYVMAAVLCLLTIGGVTDNVVWVRADQEWREQVNGSWHEIDAYCRAHKENFYFEDVYSTVAFSHKLFGQRDTTYANYDILGGWMCKSPLYDEKLGRYGIISVSEELFRRDDLYVIMSDGELANRGMDWVTDYYGAQGIMVVVEQADRIDGEYAVYRVVVK